MSYNKNTWTNGDIITAEKLNNMETGIEAASGAGGGGSGGVFIITATEVPTIAGEMGQVTVDKTREELSNAINGGLIPMIKFAVGTEVYGTEYCYAFLANPVVYSDESVVTAGFVAFRFYGGVLYCWDFSFGTDSVFVACQQISVVSST